MPPSPEKTTCRYHINHMHFEPGLRMTAAQVKNPRCPKRTDSNGNLLIEKPTSLRCLIGIPQFQSLADGFVCHRNHLGKCTSIPEKARQTLEYTVNVLPCSLRPCWRR